MIKKKSKKKPDTAALTASINELYSIVAKLEKRIKDLEWSSKNKPYGGGHFL